MSKKIAEIQLFEILESIERSGAKINGRSIETIGHTCRKTYTNRFGSLKTAIVKYHEWKQKDNIQYELKEQQAKDDYSILKCKYNELQKEVNFQNRIVETFIQYIQALPAISIPKKIQITEHQNIIVPGLLLSDCHIGEKISADDTGGLSEYNIKLFEARLNFMAETIIKLCKRDLKNYIINELFIAMLGDIVSGIIHQELREENELNIIEQIVQGSSILSQFLLTLAQYFPTINIHCVVGNHQRMFDKPHFKKKYAGFDYLCYKFMETQLKNQTNIKFHIPKSFWSIANINNNNLLLMHGDNIRSYLGLPFYGIDRMTKRLENLLVGHYREVLDEVKLEYEHIKTDIKIFNKNELLQYCEQLMTLLNTVIQADKQYLFKDVLLGHFHSTNSLDRVNGEILINGSLTGASEFSIGKLYTGTDPKQWFICIHAEHGITFRTPINLKFVNI